MKILRLKITHLSLDKIIIREKVHENFNAFRENEAQV